MFLTCFQVIQVAKHDTQLEKQVDNCFIMSLDGRVF